MAVSLLVLPACKGGANVDAVKLVPDEAEFVVGVNPKAVTGSEVYKAFSGDLEKEADYKEMVEALKGCNLEVSSFDRFVVGATAKEDFVAVVEAAGIGKDENATCIINKIAEESGEEANNSVSNKDGKKIVQFADGRAYLVNDNMLAIATTSWEDKVGALIDGEGKPAVDNSKKDLYGAIDNKAAVWFVAAVPTEVSAMGAMFGAPELADVKTAAGSLDLSSGVGVNLIVDMADEAKAKAAADKANGMLEEVKKAPQAKDFDSTMKSLEIKADGGKITIKAAASMDDINKAKELAPGM